MSNNKQSSVEWVIENLTLMHALLSRREIGVEFFNKKYNEIVEQAKVMHKEEIIKTAVRGYLSMPDKFDLEEAKEYGQQYYNIIFNPNKGVNNDGEK